MLCIVPIALAVWYYQPGESREEAVFPSVQTPTPSPIPAAVTIPNGTQVFQTFNNCGPAALSMALSYEGITISQQELGRILRPYQNPQGDNDDKSVTLSELARYATSHNLAVYHRPNGSLQTIKQFIASGIPVIVRTRLKIDDDIGHFRIIKGYDDATGEFIQDDSLQGKDLKYSYDTMFQLWQTFGFEYLVIVSPDSKQTAERILGDDVDEKTAWQNARSRAQLHSDQRPADIYARLSLSVALYHTGEYAQSVKEFETVQSQLPMRTLWYQIEPILSYMELGEFDNVLSITQNILSNQNRAFSELYLIRGAIYENRGDKDSARAEYEKAVLYNSSLEAAKQALQSIQ